MDFSAVYTLKAVRIYQTQTRIAELNKKANINSIQGQIDLVEISSKAHQLAQLKMLSNAIADKVPNKSEKIDSIVE
tara:strand:+ start:1930 stop:2157 length:228 start_codon:yes stop_codon:yes gene_type:complete